MFDATPDQIQDQDAAARMRADKHSWAEIAEALAITPTQARLYAEASDKRLLEIRDRTQIPLF